MDGEAYRILLLCTGGFSDLELCTLRLCAYVRLSGLRSIFCSLRNLCCAGRLCYTCSIMFCRYTGDVLKWSHTVDTILHSSCTRWNLTVAADGTHVREGWTMCVFFCCCYPWASDVRLIYPDEVRHNAHDVNAIAVGYDRVSYIRGSSSNLIDNKT